MRILRWLLLSGVVTGAMVLAATALGVAPWPGLARAVVSPSGDVRYTASRDGAVTSVRAVRVGGAELRAASFRGAYGIPAVTSTGLGGGLSPDGRLLVLVEPPNYRGLREQSRFLVVSTRTLSLAAELVVSGEFGFDAVSPDNRTLYLIERAAANDLVRYVVRAYDLRTKRLLPGAIVDPRQPGETMRGFPVARAASARGVWVYTLYDRPNRNPFVHALNTVRRSAFCIDLPRIGGVDGIWAFRLELANGGRELVVRSHLGEVEARVDTKTLRVR